MKRGWNEAKEQADKHANQGGMFVRLINDGDKVIGAFCGEPLAREVIWTGERYEDYDPAVHTEKKPSLRISINFFVPAEGGMKVIEGGSAWFKDVLKVRDKYGLEKWLFEIERHGGAGDTKTTYTILPEEKLDKEMLAKIAEATEHDLEAIAQGQFADKSDDKPAKKSNGGFINAKVAGGLVARLKARPKPEVAAFLAEFGVQTVKQLAADDEERAIKYIDRLEAGDRKQPQAPADAQEEIDPFG